MAATTYPSPKMAIRKVARASTKYEDAKADRLDAVCSALDAGASVTDVAEAVGLTRAAIYKMVERSGHKR